MRTSAGLGAAAGAALLAACAAAPTSGVPAADDAVQPKPALRQLAPLLGEWESTSPRSRQWRAEHPEDGAPRRSRWILDGAAMEHVGWRFDPGAEQPVHWREVQAWDAAGGEFVSFYADDHGAWATVRTRFAADGRSFEQSDVTVEADGTRTHGSGSARFLDADTLEWTWREGDAAPPVVTRSHRVRPALTAAPTAPRTN